MKAIYLLPLALVACKPNYDDCLKKALNTSKSKEVASMKIRACQLEFGEVVEAEPIKEVVASQPTTYTLAASLSTKDGLEVIKGIKLFSENNGVIGVTNHNNLPLVKVKMGYTNLMACPRNENEYSQFYMCTGYVSAMNSGYMDCENFIHEEQNACIVNAIYENTETSSNNAEKKSEYKSPYEYIFDFIASLWK